MSSTDCLFCALVAGKIPATVVAETNRTLAFYDIKPVAPVHVLVVPKEHHANVAALASADPSLLAEVIEVAGSVAADLSDGQFRTVFNTGQEAGQTVFHVHAHVLAGAKLGAFA